MNKKICGGDDLRDIRTSLCDIQLPWQASPAKLIACHKNRRRRFEISVSPFTVISDLSPRKLDAVGYTSTRWRIFPQNFNIILLWTYRSDYNLNFVISFVSQKIFGRKISPKILTTAFQDILAIPEKFSSQFPDVQNPEYAPDHSQKLITFSALCLQSTWKSHRRNPSTTFTSLSRWHAPVGTNEWINATRSRNLRGGGHTRERSTALRMTELTMTDQMRWPDIAGPDRDGSSLFRVHTYVILTNTLCQTVNVANNPTFSALCLQSTWKSHLRNPSYSAERHCEMSRNFNLVGYGTSDVRCAWNQLHKDTSISDPSTSGPALSPDPDIWSIIMAWMCYCTSVLHFQSTFKLSVLLPDKHCS